MGSPASIAELEAKLESATPGERTGLQLELGRRWSRIGVPEQAMRWLSAARTSADPARGRTTIAEIDLYMGQVSMMRGEHDRALTFLDRALDTAEAAGDGDLRARVVATLADHALRRGEVARAAELFDVARGHFDSYWNGAELARCLAGLAMCALETGRVDEAVELIRTARDEAGDADDPLLGGRVDLAAAAVALARGAPQDAATAFRRAIARFAENDLRRDLAESHLRFGLLCGDLAENGTPLEQPAGHLARALELFRELGGLPDLERVRDAFRRYGRRATDRVAESELARLLDELRGQRSAVHDAAGHLHDLVLRRADDGGTVDGALLQAAEGGLTRSLAELASVEERFVTAVNAVVVEREHIRTLLDLTRVLATTTDFGALPETVSRLACQLTGGDRAVMQLAGGELGAWGIDEQKARPWDQAMADAGGKIVLIPGKIDDRSRVDRLRTRAGARLGASMVVPLRSGEAVLGQLWVDKTPSGGLFTERDLDLLAVFAGQAAILLINARIAEQLRLAARTTTATLEAISDGVLSLDAHGAIRAHNAAAARILGLRGADNPPPGAIAELDVLRASLNRGEELDGRIVTLATGEFLCNTRVVRDDDGEPAGLIATFTELKRATSLAQRMVGSSARYSFGDIIGRSGAVRRTLTLAQAAARSDASVLITGESGTGKEVLAQAIHNGGARAAGPFVAVNCAAIPRDLLESELFGYDAGAFTGARKGGRPGKFELAEGGTILLDEIGDMPLEMQAKLLRVLQERTTMRLGGTREVPISCRILATTNRDLGTESRRGLFRQDLFFRLRVIHIELPPLRERREDVEFLTTHFLEVYSARAGKRLTGVAPAVMEALLAYPWPGNIRELEHVLESEVTMASADQQELVEVPLMLQQQTAAAEAAAAAPPPGAEGWPPWPYPWWPGGPGMPGGAPGGPGGLARDAGRRATAGLAGWAPPAPRRRGATPSARRRRAASPASRRSSRASATCWSRR
ncbi:MAG: sigma 54-interacting transcriptional regulator [Kofleriaceae bacterium]|nr:sigma 54-interacting transcriptional regulator [Kofleriaceae bacterium]